MRLERKIYSINKVLTKDMPELKKEFRWKVFTSWGLTPSHTTKGRKTLIKKAFTRNTISVRKGSNMQ